jgi:hypothetical protein
MVRCFLVISGLVVLGRLTMMLGRVLVVVGGMLVVFVNFVAAHRLLPG